MKWDIVNGCIRGLLSESESDTIVPQGVGIRDGKIVTIRFPDGIRAIGTGLCENCQSLESIIIPEGTVEVSTSAFKGCKSLKHVELSSTIKELGYWAFQDCTALEQIELPNSITEIGSGAFKGCSSLRYIKMPPVLNTNLLGDVFSDCESLAAVAIPEGIRGLCGTFENCKSLRDVQLSNTITEIYSDTFENCVSLEKIHLPQGLKKFSISAVKNCKKITSIVFPDCVEKFEPWSDGFCTMDSLKNVTLPASICKLPTFFEKTEKTDYWNTGYIDHGWKSTRPKPESYRQQSSYEPITTYEYTPYGMFQHSKSLKSMMVPGSVEIIDVCCFANCNQLENVTLQEGTKIIRDYAFAECPKLREIILPNTLETIERYAFKNCAEMTTLHIGPYVSLIEEGAFKGCEKLRLTVKTGSYAESYAIENGIPFIYV